MNTAYKVKRLNGELIIVLFYLFLSRYYKVMCLFPFRQRQRDIRTKRQGTKKREANKSAERENDNSVTEHVLTEHVLTN